MITKVKVDWVKHRQQFSQMREKQEFSIKDYAELHGLNPNTARRHLGTGQSQVSAKASTSRSKVPPRSIDRKPQKDHGSDQSVSNGNESTASKIKELNKQVNESVKRTPSPGAATPAAVLAGELMEVVSAKTKSGRAGDQSKNGGRVLQGALMPDDEDIEQARLLMDAAGVDAIEARVIQSALCSLFTLERVTAEMMKQLQDHVPGEDEPPTINKMLSVAAAAAAAINDTARTMAAVRQSYAKDQREMELHMRKLSEPERVMEAYRMRKDKGWTAMETAIYIETHGYKVPSLLLEMARAEMKAGEQDDINTKPVDLKQLDDQARSARAERMAALDMELAAKREAVNKIVDRGGFGDVAADGSLNDINLTADFEEGEEPDEDINNMLYGKGDDHQQE
ncbi:hypothetical protein [Pantoea sp. CCBC3-3-1]|uniref:hypothetical protein n=1 Tax=Pantoea sp. CCBC3-3-1 TaxID=2490851 RepID=UPI0011BE9CCF|nr:hypothetical protein [Pantoea sp. CCBC3-3-1]